MLHKRNWRGTQLSLLISSSCSYRTCTWCSRGFIFVQMQGLGACHASSKALIHILARGVGEWEKKTREKRKEMLHCSQLRRSYQGLDYAPTLRYGPKAQSIACGRNKRRGRPRPEVINPKMTPPAQLAALKFWVTVTASPAWPVERAGGKLVGAPRPRELRDDKQERAFPRKL